eukprot:5148988-Prymnesium_polylepis.2
MKPDSPSMPGVGPAPESESPNHRSNQLQDLEGSRRQPTHHEILGGLLLFRLVGGTDVRGEEHEGD